MSIHLLFLDEPTYRIMKARLLSFFSILFLLSITVNAQTLAALQNAFRSPDKAVQAIHGYPASVYEGKCHWVPVSSMDLRGDQITITETWSSPYGQATTTLSGTVRNGRVSGNWASGFSSGTWSYNFASATGQWNKTKSMSITFAEMYFLKFRIVAKNNLLDGPYDCN
jgi:hypothetical protein